MAALPSGGTWDSAQPAAGFAAVRSVGFEPVGQVFGAAVYYLATVAGAGCPGTTAAGYQRQDAAAAVSRAGVASPAGRLATWSAPRERPRAIGWSSRCAGWALTASWCPV
jgi:hypothetical protein